MLAPTTEDRTPGGDAGQASAPPAPLLDSLLALFGEIPGLVSDRVQLLSLELQRAGRAMARIVLLLVATAILGVTAWIAMWGVVVGGLTALGMHWALALLSVLAVNLIVAALAVARLRDLTQYLQLPATVRNLTLRTVPSMPPESSHDHTALRETSAS